MDSGVSLQSTLLEQPRQFPSLFEDREVRNAILSSAIMGEENALAYARGFQGGETYFTRGRAAYEERRRFIHEHLKDLGFGWDDERHQGRLICSERYPHVARLLSYRGIKTGDNFDVKKRGAMTLDLMKHDNIRLRDQLTLIENTEPAPATRTARYYFAYYVICELVGKAPNDLELSVHLTLPFSYDTRTREFRSAVSCTLCSGYRLQEIGDYSPDASLRRSTGNPIEDMEPVVSRATAASSVLDFDVTLKVDPGENVDPDSVQASSPIEEEVIRLQGLSSSSRNQPPSGLGNNA